MRYTGQQCLNFFVLTNLKLIETPGLQEAIKNNLREYDNILQEQVFLQDNGVSFSYSDSISYMERQDILDAMIKYNNIKNEKLEETYRNQQS